ncbi:hypothetical protein I79_023595 [Cricetulus griseus]|uniref:Uncharacterized protein n=1 Tax=Cricetulus griseus TaxID=10029 RepID=G3IIC7_CRIGR|nr:hypothetical protein I79_023595 [Cricetulus griseus]
MGKLLRIASVLYTVGLSLPSGLLICCEMHSYNVWSTFYCGHVIKYKIGNLLSSM